MGSMPALPLFPLSNVLVPGAALRLRLFEPRYLELLDDLLRAPQELRLFGVVLIAQGHEVGTRPSSVRGPGQRSGPTGTDPAGATGGNQLHEVGCVARLEETTSLTDQGGSMFAVRAVGTRRFRIRQLRSTAHRYAVADVDWLDDTPVDRAVLAQEATALRVEHAAYGRRLGATIPALSDADDVAAWQASEFTILTPGDLQALLTIDDPLARTRAMRDYLRREARLAAKFPTVPHLAEPGGVGLN